MNTDVENILKQGIVTNGAEEFLLHSAISGREGKLIEEIVAEVQPKVYLEVGFAYGISALYAAKALQRLGHPYTHHIIDPSQQTHWHNVGIHYLKSNGLWHNVRFHEMGSELALPQLEREGLKIDVAFVDGWHTFDHALVDFFYINRMLRVGGVVIFDDANWQSISKLLRYVQHYPCYEYYKGAGRMSGLNILSRVKEGKVPSIRRSIKRLLSATRPSIVALRKVMADERSWEWYHSF
jgi:predicted O-methyltransferase YrrM